MLFHFDPFKVTFKKIKLKSISTMMGGVLTYLDENNQAEKEHFIRVSIPSSLATLYRRTHTISQYLKPQECCIMLYGDKIIAIEKHIINERFELNRHGVQVEWKSYLELNFNKALNKMWAIRQEWYFDGSYLFSFSDDVTNLYSKGTALSDDGKFRAISVDAMRVATLNGVDGPLIVTRHCLFYSPNGTHYSISPPIWGSIGLGRGSSSVDDDTETTGLAAHFDQTEIGMAVNLNFALIAGNLLTRQFGYKSIEPLQLPKLMIQLKTVNLPNLTAGVKSTFDIGISFKQVLAWLMGLLSRAKTFDEMIALRTLIRYATSRGLFRKESVAKLKSTTNIVPLFTPAEALERAKDYMNAMTISDIRQAELILDEVGV